MVGRRRRTRGLRRDRRAAVRTYIHDGRRALLAGSVGLGLNIARSLAEAMGGSLEYSRNDGATWFTLVSPIAETSVRATEAVDVGVA